MNRQIRKRTYGGADDKALEFVEGLKVLFQGCSDSEGEASEGKGGTGLEGENTYYEHMKSQGLIQGSVYKESVPHVIFNFNVPRRACRTRPTQIVARARP